MKRFSLVALLSVTFFCSWGQTTTFNYTGSMETYTVPSGITNISIQAYGAQGGNDNGGLGAGIYGEFTVTPGDVLNIIVGQQGIVNNCGGPDASGGGGGGSFIWDPTDTALPLVAAGAGGGGNENWGGLECRDGLPGQAGEDGTSGSEGLASGGTSGAGGAGDAPSGTGSGGGGWLSAGGNSTWGDGCTGGITLPSFTGGIGAASFGPGGEGGYGGGGGAVCGCGGGSGYSGGAGGNGSSCRAGGGGGGSYNQGTGQVNQTGVRSGNGQIIITVVCSPITVTVSDYYVCLGETFTLDASGDGVISWDGGVSNGTPFTTTTVGITTYTSTSDFGGDCDFSVDIEVLELPTIAYTTIDEISGGDGSIDITVTGGTPAYSYDWNNDGTGDFDDLEDLTGLAGGTFIVAVKDDSTCLGRETIILGSQVGMEEFNMLNVEVYPNPASEIVTIKLEGEFSYQLKSINGTILTNGIAFDKESIDINKFANGVYIISIETDKATKQMRIIKK